MGTYNKLALLVLRDYARRQRKERARAVREARQDAERNTLRRLAERRDNELRKKQMKLALSLVHWDVTPDSVADYDECMADTTKGSKGRQEECMRENYHAITTGWGFQAGVTVANSKANYLCPMCKCACKGGWKKGHHMEVVQ